MPLLLLALALLFNCAAAAQPAPYPSKPVRLVVPYGPGGATDIVARILGDHLRETLGQPFVVDNKPGGNGVVALQEVARAKPDGYTLLIGNVTTQMLNPLIEGSKMPVNAFKDIVPIARLVDIPGVFLATKVKFPPNSVQEVVDYARSHPGEINYNSAGYLAYSHVDFLMLQKKTGTQMTLIPLKAGAGGGQIDLINGEVHIGLQNAATVIPLVKGGKLKALAVTSETRLPELPDVPTMKEAGFGDIGTNAWQAMYAPAGTPQEILDKILSATLSALNDKKVQGQLQDLQFTLIPTKTLSEVQDWMKREVDVWTPMVKDAKEMAEKQG